MINSKDLSELMTIDNAILEIIDNQDEFTRSDLQGCVSAQIQKAYLLGYKQANNQ